MGRACRVGRLTPRAPFPKSVEACMECSARTLHGVADVFATATRLVMYPMRPLFDVKAMVRASTLRRVILASRLTPGAAHHLPLPQRPGPRVSGV